MNGQTPNYLTNRFSIKDSGYALRHIKSFPSRNQEQSSKEDHSLTVVPLCAI